MTPYKVLFSMMILLLFINCDKGSALVEKEPVIKPTVRILKFSGFDWIVRNTKASKEGPGPNYFSDSEDNVWIDDSGKLHLKITQKGGIWYCAGLNMKNSLSYGKYTFYINSDLSSLDDQVVAGLFTYLTDEEEIDIEFSKWGLSNNVNAQYAVQPSTKVGNKLRFDILPNLGPTAHSFIWEKDEIAFESLSSYHTENPNILHTWLYLGSNIPLDKAELLKINLWLFKGQMPRTLKEQEMVIDSVKFQPIP